MALERPDGLSQRPSRAFRRLISNVHRYLVIISADRFRAFQHVTSVMEMSGKPTDKLRPLPVYDYSSAIANAVEWLGDRYLLAKSINATPQSRTLVVAPILSSIGPGRSAR